MNNIIFHNIYLLHFSKIHFFKNTECTSSRLKKLSFRQPRKKVGHFHPLVSDNFFAGACSVKFKIQNGERVFQSFYKTIMFFFAFYKNRTKNG